MPDPYTIPFSDPGLGGSPANAPGGVSTGSGAGGGSASIPGYIPVSSGAGGAATGALDPLGRQIPAEVTGAGGLAGIWEEIKTGAPVAGVYALLALLFLIGVMGLIFSSGVGRAVGRGAAAEVTGGASEVGRAVGRKITRRKPPRKKT